MLSSNNRKGCRHSILSKDWGRPKKASLVQQGKQLVNEHHPRSVLGSYSTMRATLRILPASRTSSLATSQTTRREIVTRTSCRHHWRLQSEINSHCNCWTSSRRMKTITITIVQTWKHRAWTSIRHRSWEHSRWTWLTSKDILIARFTISRRKCRMQSRTMSRHLNIGNSNFQKTLEWNWTCSRI